MKAIDVGIAEDHLLIRQGFVSMLKEEGMNVIFDVSNGKELLDRLSVSVPDIILLDIQMPVMDGNEAYAIIKKKYPHTKVIILSMHYNEAYISKFLMDGAAGFLAKNCDLEKLLHTIYAVHSRGRYIDPSIPESVYERCKTDDSSKKLSDRQIEIIRFLYYEKNVEEISKLLFLSKRTVEWHKNRIFEKTDTKSVIGLLKYAISNGIITL